MATVTNIKQVRPAFHVWFCGNKIQTRPIGSTGRAGRPIYLDGDVFPSAIEAARALGQENTGSISGAVRGSGRYLGAVCRYATLEEVMKLRGAVRAEVMDTERKPKPRKKTKRKSRAKAKPAPRPVAVAAPVLVPGPTADATKAAAAILANPDLSDAPARAAALALLRP